MSNSERVKVAAVDFDSGDCNPISGSGCGVFLFFASSHRQTLLEFVVDCWTGPVTRAELACLYE